MAVPPWPQFLEPVLKVLAEAKAPLHRRELSATVIERMSLSAADLAEMAGATKHTKAYHRAAWALSYASMASLVDSPERGFWRLAAAGRALLSKYPRGIPETELQRIGRVRKRGQEGGAGEELPDAVAARADVEDTPEERLRQAHAELRQSVRTELLNALRSISPTKFEEVVLDVLHAMGYGKNRRYLQKTAAGADGGIDGVISVDRLGLEKVYVQAKRYAEDNKVSRPAIQAFLGALSERRAIKGVFITTSAFSKEARESAVRASDSLVLIDGEELAELMMEHGVGVSVRETFSRLTLDGDYFEDE
jgi:restriction system protein